MLVLISVVTSFNLSDPFFSEEKTASCCEDLRYYIKSTGLDAKILVDVITVVIVIIWM